jgi:hypothetical protein
MIAFESNACDSPCEPRGHLLIINNRIEGVSISHRANAEEQSDGNRDFVLDPNGTLLLGTNLWTSRCVLLEVVAHFYEVSRILLAQQLGLESVASQVWLERSEAESQQMSNEAFSEQAMAGAIKHPGFNLMSMLGMTPCGTLTSEAGVVCRFQKHMRTG